MMHQFIYMHACVYMCVCVEIAIDMCYFRYVL